MSGAVDEFEFFLAKEWSDGLPVVTPTEARLQWMLKGTTLDPEKLIGFIPPAGEPASVRTIAIHALMAGCKPEYLPVVIGAGGVEKVIEIALDDVAKANLQVSVDAVKELLDACKGIDPDLA